MNKIIKVADKFEQNQSTAEQGAQNDQDAQKNEVQQQEQAQPQQASAYKQGQQALQQEEEQEGKFKRGTFTNKWRKEADKYNREESQKRENALRSIMGDVFKQSKALYERKANTQETKAQYHHFQKQIHKFFQDAHHDANTKMSEWKQAAQKEEKGYSARKHGDRETFDAELGDWRHQINAEVQQYKKGYDKSQEQWLSQLQEEFDNLAEKKQNDLLQEKASNAQKIDRHAQKERTAARE